jgi:hypothetical protein
MQPLGDTLDKQVDHLELEQIAADKRLVFRPQLLRVSLIAVRLNSDWPSSSANSASIWRVDSARAYIHRQRLQFLAQPGAKRRRAVRDPRRSVFDPVFSRPVR